MNRGMNHLLDDEEDLETPRERELTLSTGTILALFFGLALLCGLFFAFGYSVGHRSGPETSVTAQTEGASPSANFSSFKPSAGTAAGTPVVAPAVATTPAAQTTATPVRETVASNAPTTTAAAQPAAPVVRQAPAAPTTTLVETPAVSGVYMVQVAAVSHQEDAELLLQALKQRGYAVAAHSLPTDTLIHIQVGPFSNRKDADTMRARLLSDGYNAIVK